jgi:signal transduction histidine kinase
MEVRALRLTLEVEDDGRGFDPHALEATSSLGLLGMRERARALDGEVRFAPRTGGGTVVEVSIPLRSAQR